MNEIMFINGKTVKYISIGTAVLLLIVGGTAAVKYHSVRKNPLPPEKLSGPLINPAKDIKPATIIKIDTVYRCPWGTKPFEADIKAGAGAQICRQPEIKLSKLGWGKNEYKIHAEIQPFRTGNIPESQMDVKFNAGPERPEIQISEKIPGFKTEALPISNDAKLSIASEIKEQKPLNKTYIIIAAALIAIAAVAIILFLKKKKKVIVKSIWELALENLSGLKYSLGKGEIGAGECLFKLTDIIRDYLEKRLGMHASRQTTAEFLQDIDRPGSPLPEQYRGFLKDFMNAADMVKFAGTPAEGNLLNTAFEKAESLVRETTPGDKERNGK